jgi:lipopolysaccharide transport system ATP-binding protein
VGVMSSDVIISVENLGKRYRLGAHSNERYTALRDVIANKTKSLFRRSRLTSDGKSQNSNDFWALRNVNFEVKQGEVLGIIGRNGAGKSTMLKILSRITEPTEGRVKIKGRVASLLEVGTGFHPELTGRENIFLNGAVLGMTRAEIKLKFDEIVAFAEVERFLETPVKRYSSGMYVRLAFAVAAHLEPEILIVDEVLAVGDAEFQKKCLGKMREVAEGSGRTVLFVSHNMAAIQALCSTGLLLDSGKTVIRGSVSEAVRFYLKSSDSTDFTSDRALSSRLRLSGISSTPSVIESNSRLAFRIILAAIAGESEIISDLALLIHSANGGRAALVDLRSFKGPYRLEAEHELRVSVVIDNVPLVEGDFDVGLYVNAESVCDSFMNLLSFTVLPRDKGDGVVPRDAQFRGVVELISNGECGSRRCCDGLMSST